ncbi:unnamed protein product [Brassicogethes aeneus]|uniref:Uncharacterized protein n=1 Tax=Brassicogethes aeneus TaxID=1431903 RepID=A0A9P0AZL6_BRAAE|nr:unnamed protein product [Brassicogethes aeneus]
MEKKRFQSERDSHGETQNQLRFEKQRAAKLEASLARMELDQNVSNYASSTSIIRAQDNISKLKDELELTQEQIKALKNRLEIEKREKNSDFKEFSKILQEFCKNT